MHPYFYEIVWGITALLFALQWIFGWYRDRSLVNNCTGILTAFLLSIPIQFVSWGCERCGQGVLLIFLLVPFVLVLIGVAFLSRYLVVRLWFRADKSGSGDMPTGT